MQTLKVRRRTTCSSLISVAGRVVFGADDQTTALFRTTVDGLDDVYQLLLVFQDPVEFIIVSGTEIDHHVFISKEEHDCARVVEFCRREKKKKSVKSTDKRRGHRLTEGREGEGGEKRTVHLIEIRHLVNIAHVDDCKALDLVGNLVEHLVLAHAVWVPVAAEADDD